jgi:hypothetical protein
MRSWVGGIVLLLAVGGYYFLATPTARVLDLDGRPAAPFTSSKPVLLLFTRDDCPISNRYAPEVHRLFKRFATEVDFYLVYPDPDTDAAAVKNHLQEYDYAIPALLDPDHTLVDQAQASITPEAALYLPGQQLVYRGRIDNRYVDFGQTRPKATRHDLEEALVALGADQVPDTLVTTTAVGCFITDLK